MISHLIRENCSHCLKSVYIGQLSFECYKCNCIIHSKCFSPSKAEIIDCNYFCNSCKDDVVTKYNPFKYFENDDEPMDCNDDISKITTILESCQTYTVNDLNASHNENFKNFSTSYFLNIDGNKSNFNSLVAELHRINHEFSVIALAETNIGPEESSVYTLQNYNSFYQNTQDKKAKGTGVAIYVNDKINAVVNETVSEVTENVESLFVTTRNNCSEVTFGVIYRPPNGNFTSFCDELSKILEQLPKKSVYIMGDFNVNLHVNSKEVNDFEEAVFTAGFSPLISTYTHEKPGCRQTCIDNILTNDINNTIASGTISESISHHLPIFHIFNGFSAQNSTQPNAKYIQYYDYSDSNIQQFVSNLEKDLSENPPFQCEICRTSLKANRANNSSDYPKMPEHNCPLAKLKETQILEDGSQWQVVCPRLSFDHFYNTFKTKLDEVS